MSKSFTPHMTIEKWFFLLITTFIIYLFWQVLEPFILVLLLAGVVAIILSPIEHRLRKLLKRPRLSAAILSLCVFFLIFIPLLITLVIMATQASELVQISLANPNWLEQIDPATSPLVQTLPQFVQDEIIALNVSEIGKSIASWAFNNIGNIFSSTTKLILNTFIFFLCLYYLLVDRKKLYDEALVLSPLEDTIDSKILKRIVSTVRSVVFGILILAIIQGILAGIGMTIFGVPGALIWGTLTIVAAMVPLVGTGLVMIPAILYLFFTGSTGAAIGLLIWSVAFVSTADNYIGPYLISGTTHMHSFLVLLVVLGGITTFGPMGIIAGPTILAALLALIELYKSGILTTGKLQKTERK
jgi:predicted PurR-regulated permease PerM